MERDEPVAGRSLFNGDSLREFSSRDRPSGIEDEVQSFSFAYRDAADWLGIQE